MERLLLLFYNNCGLSAEKEYIECEKSLLILSKPLNFQRQNKNLRHLTFGKKIIYES